MGEEECAGVATSVLLPLGITVSVALAFCAECDPGDTMSNI
jgi:hypothetical protein